MRRKRHRPIFVRKCDYCGTELQLNEPNSDSYVVTMEHKYFCKIHYVGEEPIKDCLEDYKNQWDLSSDIWKDMQIGNFTLEKFPISGHHDNSYYDRNNLFTLH